MSQVYEIEIKSLLGSEESANNLKNKLFSSPLNFKLASKSKQLNHYFIVPRDLNKLKNNLIDLIPDDKKGLFENIIQNSTNLSVRTRETDGKVLFIVKASIGSDSSANGVSRMEFEVPINVKDIGELDQILLDSDLSYQAKWSREREEYKTNSINICLDKNAGYGYLAEFEKVIVNENEKEKAKLELENLMNEFGVKELPQDRLERMFSYYNEHWPEYYGTENIFNIE